MSNLKTYIVYDGRAEYDIDSASIVEFISEATKKAAKKEFFSHWGDHGCILFSYDADGDTLTNGKLVARSKNITSKA